MNKREKKRKHKKYELSLMHKILAKLAGPNQFTEWGNFMELRTACLMCNGAVTVTSKRTRVLKEIIKIMQPSLLVTYKLISK